jgi:hypothetical protein
MSRPSSDHHSRAGRIGAAVVHSLYSSEELTRNARVAFEARFLKAVDPDETLDPRERRRRAGHARATFYHRLSRAGVLARRRRQESRRPQIRAEAPEETDDQSPTTLSVAPTLTERKAGAP